MLRDSRHCSQHHSGTWHSVEMICTVLSMSAQQLINEIIRDMVDHNEHQNGAVPLNLSKTSCSAVTVADEGSVRARVFMLSDSMTRKNR